VHLQYVAYWNSLVGHEGAATQAANEEEEEESSPRPRPRPSSDGSCVKFFNIQIFLTRHIFLTGQIFLAVAHEGSTDSPRFSFGLHLTFYVMPLGSLGFLP